MLEQDLPGAGQTSFTRQQEPLGLGHAVWCARELVGDEPFALLLPDMVMHAKPGCLRQMIDVYNAPGGGNVIAVEEVPWDQVHRYGVVGAKDWQDNAFAIESMVEKPTREDAPSNLIISGRYILQPEIFAEIDKQAPGAGGEIQITDAMIRLHGAPALLGRQIRGHDLRLRRQDRFPRPPMSPMGLEREDLGPSFKAALRKIIDDHGGL